MTTVAREPTTDLGFDLSAIAFWQQRTLAERDAGLTLGEPEPMVSSVVNDVKFALA